MRWPAAGRVRLTRALPGITRPVYTGSSLDGTLKLSLLIGRPASASVRPLLHLLGLERQFYWEIIFSPTGLYVRPMSRRPE